MTSAPLRAMLVAALAASMLGPQPGLGGEASLHQKLAQAPAKRAAPSDKPAPKETGAPAAAKSEAGKATYEATCALCHGSGVAGAPRLGNTADWTPRLARGIDALYASALKGTDKGMPARGGNAELSDAAVKAVVDYMVAQAEQAKASSGPAAAAAAAPARAAEVASPAKPVAAQVSVAEANAFNRLLKPASKRNLPPPEDGIHDPSNDGTHALQAPQQAFDLLPRSPAGNRVNWVQALNEKKVDPRWDRIDQQAEPLVMDLNIVRKVKGSMPDVVYPHKQHTEWLDCSNCHPAIFAPQSGANQISMAAILLGQKCGVCHGKVAFPVSECRLCHSQKKDAQAAAASEAAKK